MLWSRAKRTLITKWRGPGGLSRGGKVYDSGMDDVYTGGNEYLDMVCGYRVRGG